MYERRIEVRSIVSRFSTGEIKETKSEGLAWVDENEKCPEGFVWCPISSNWPEAMEMNFRKKKVGNV